MDDFNTQSAQQAHTLASRRLNVVIVCEELPYPANSGYRLRNLHLTLPLAEQHNITLISYQNRDKKEALEAQRFFDTHGIRTVVVDHNPPTNAGIQFYARLAANIFSPKPYSVSAHHSWHLRRAVTHHALRNHVDVWQCAWSPYATMLDTLPHERIVVMAHNVESLIWKRYVEAEESRARRWFLEQQQKKFELFERAIYSRVAHTIVVSDEDANLARRDFQAKRVSVIDNGVDLTYFQPRGHSRNSKRILLLGSLDWRPNQDACRLMIEQIFPKVLISEPEAELEIVGRSPPTWLTELVGQHHRMRLHANVPDVRPWLAECGVMAVPLRIGGGSRIKILEALSMQMPVVSTTIGCEGLRLNANEHLLVADDPESFASLLVSCLREPEHALTMAQSGYEVIRTQYSWNELARRLDWIWRECASQADRAGIAA